jgi:hypothetical protein
VNNKILSIVCIVALLTAAFSIAWSEFVYTGKIAGKDARAEGVVERAERKSALLVVNKCRVHILFRDGGIPYRVEDFKLLVRKRFNLARPCDRLAETRVTLAYDRARPEEAMLLQSGFERTSMMFMALFFAGGAVFGVFYLLRRRDA